jgi:hydrogenase nickel incorporation protein HypB
MMERVTVETKVLRKNEECAESNRHFFEQHGIAAVNFMSAPGAGKTSLLERTLLSLKLEFQIAVIEGDLYTSYDADRIKAIGVPALQITTGTCCHLDARMIARTIADCPSSQVDLLVDLLVIENVGNLVCPAEFDLGEDLRIMVFSAVEGAEKPQKYPLMFQTADAVLLNKIDLIPYAGVSLEELVANVHKVNPSAPVFAVSCRSGEGIEPWIAWFRQRVAALRKKEAHQCA